MRHVAGIGVWRGEDVAGTSNGNIVLMTLNLTSVLGKSTRFFTDHFIHIDTENLNISVT